MSVRVDNYERHCSIANCINHIENCICDGVCENGPLRAIWNTDILSTISNAGVCYGFLTKVMLMQVNGVDANFCKESSLFASTVTDYA